MNETAMTLLGLYMIYSIGHLAVLQHSKVWAERTTYEKIVTCVAGFVILILLLDIGK